MAEREGFEPPEPFPVQWFSRPPPSTTRPSLRVRTPSSLTRLPLSQRLRHTSHRARRHLGLAPQRPSRFPRGDAGVSRLAGRRRNSASGRRAGSLPARQHLLHLSHAVVDGDASDPRRRPGRGRERGHAVARCQRHAGNADVSGARNVRLRTEPRCASCSRGRGADLLHSLCRVRRHLSALSTGHRTHLRRHRTLDRRARGRASRRRLVSHRRAAARHRALHSSLARIVDGCDRRTGGISRISAGSASSFVPPCRGLLPVAVSRLSAC